MMNVPFQQVQTQVYIEFLNGPLVNQHFPLERAEIHIGSQQDNTIVIPDQSILPLHASLFWHEGRLAIQSRNAQASVKVNQAFIPAQGTYLNPDDVIGLGKSGIVFRLVSGKTLSAPHMAILPSTPGNTTVIRQTGSHAATSSQQAGQPHAGAAQAPTETTRYLCFAARIDEGFCNYVFRHIVGEKHRAIVESHGVDLVAVVKSCYAARKKVFTRDAVLCVLLAILLLLCIVVIASLSYIFMQAPLLVIIIVPLVLMLLIFLTLLVMLAHVKKIPLPIRVILLLIAILLLTYGTLFFLLLFLAAWAAILRHLWVTYYGAEAQQLRMGNLASETFQLPSDLEPELQRLSGLHENIIAYSGSSPFVGSGFAASDVDKDGVDGWSFAIDATKAKKEADVPEPFQMEELYRCV
ncbi:MAG: FHA domain-containing protein, partial [Ktedonobacteraceae bacterium]